MPSSIPLASTEAKAFASAVSAVIVANADANCEVVLTELLALYDALSADARTIVDSSNEAIFDSVRVRMAYLESYVASLSAPDSLNRTTNEVNSTLIIGLIGLTSILGSYFLNKKKELTD